MSQSLVQNNIHIIFSTKNREPFIDDDIEKELYAYLSELIWDIGSTPFIVGGYLDHVHILCGLSKNTTLAALIQKVKGTSSKWIKTKGLKYESFYWQNGYAAFSIGRKEFSTVKEYIRNQHQHHQNESFQDEFRRLMKENDVEFDERYVWE